MMTPKGWKIMDKPRPGESLKQFIKRLTDEDSLMIRDRERVQNLRWADWKVNEGNNSEDAD